MYDEDDEMVEYHEIMNQGYAFVTCPNPECEEEGQVEPDADYDCPVCGEPHGWVSPLVKAGLI